MTDIETLRALIAAATAGPWYTLGPPWLSSGNTSILSGSPDPHVATFICDFDFFCFDEEDERTSENPDEDADLIVAMRNEIEGLLTELERLRQIAPAMEKRAAALRATGQESEALQFEVFVGDLRAGVVGGS